MSHDWLKVLEDVKKETKTGILPSTTKEEYEFDTDMPKHIQNDLQQYDDWISLQMDNKIFTTTRDTLTSDKDSILCMMFTKTESPFKISQNLSHPLKPYLFDRNPEYFEPILNYLRNGKLIMNDNVNPLGVLYEAKYFNIKGVSEQLSIQLSEQEKQKRLELNKPELSREFIIKALITCPSGSANLRFQGLNLSNLDLSGLDLSGINFQRSNLKGANLSNCTLTKADFTHCLLQNADLSNANLTDCKLIKSDLKNSVFTGAKLKGADMQQSDMTECCLRNCDLTDCNMSCCILLNADLSFALTKGIQLSRAVMTGMKRQGSFAMSGIVGVNSLQ